MRAFYNEIDPYCCAWISNLMDAGHITPGVIDDRSIVELTPDDVRGFDRVHCFAGIAIWDYALNLAGWGERSIWTASMPCQPFSAAGKGLSHTDRRHLAPVWLRLVSECRPAVAIGEQVSAAVGMGWLDALCISLEQSGYACGAAVFPACSVGAPHLRQRLYWVAESAPRRAIPGGCSGDLMAGSGRETTEGASDAGRLDAGAQRDLRHLADDGCDGEPRAVADAADSGRQHEPREHAVPGAQVGDEPVPESRPVGEPDIVGDADDAGPQGRGERGNGTGELPSGPSGVAGATNGFWADAVWIACRDGKARPAKRGIFPLAPGHPGRVGMLRAAGNSIVAPQAAEFIRCVMLITGDKE